MSMGNLKNIALHAKTENLNGTIILYGWHFPKYGSEYHGVLYTILKKYILCIIRLII